MDHHGFFLDHDNSVLFGNQTAIIQSLSQPGLTSKAFKHCKTYIASRWKYLHHHKWFERLQAALHSEEVPSTTLEALDFTRIYFVTENGIQYATGGER
jgi:hypothetical protein